MKENFLNDLLNAIIKGNYSNKIENELQNIHKKNFKYLAVLLILISNHNI